LVNGGGTPLCGFGCRGLHITTTRVCVLVTVRVLGGEATVTVSVTVVVGPAVVTVTVGPGVVTVTAGAAAAAAITGA
jgi:hypothetical protein